MTAANAAPVFEERYRAFVQNSAEGIWRCETDEPIDTGLAEDAQIEAFYRSGYFAESNNAFARMYGFDNSAALTGARLATLFGKDNPAHLAYLQAFIRSGYRLTDAELRETDATGNTRIFSSSLTGVVEDGKLVRAWGTRREITAQKRLEEALRTSEERLRLALASGCMGTWDADLATGRLTLSEDIPPLYGRPRQAITLPVADWINWLHPDDRNRVSLAFASALRGESDYDVQFRTLWPDGETFRWIATRALITRDADGTPLRAVGYTRDITREKEQEAEREALLARQRQFMRDFVFSLTEGKFRLCHGENDLPQPLLSAADPVVLTVPTLRTLRQALNTVTGSLGFCPERAQDIETAVGEAIMNAATHGGGGEGHVCADPARGIVQIWIRDRGVGISEEALPKVLGKGVSLAGTLGHGFWLMLSTGDRVFLLSGPNGTTIVLEQECTVPKPVWL